MVQLGWNLELNPSYDPSANIWSDNGHKYKCWGYLDCPRHHPILVQVVEELGDRASGSCADLRIAEVEGLYRIDEYDGSESVVSPDGYDWQYADNTDYSWTPDEMEH